MPFRRPSRKNRSASRKKVYKRSYKKRNHKRKSRASSAKMSAVMKDRTFTNFKYVTLTSNSISNFSTTAKGLLPASASGGISNPTTADMFYFTPQYNILNGTPSTYTGFRLLPGNSLQLVNQDSAITGTPYYSDIFAQVTPTGFTEWSNFYSRYFCHGSTIEVTLVSPSFPGQLVVVPITMDQPLSSVNVPAGYDYNIANSTNSNSLNLRNLLNFSCLPDDQPYSKIKLCSTAGGMDRVRIKHRMTTRKLYDLKIITDDNGNSGEMVASNVAVAGQVDPAVNQWGWFIAYVPVTEQSVTAPSSAELSIQVKITYHVELTDRKELSYNGAF